MPDAGCGRRLPHRRLVQDRCERQERGERVNVQGTRNVLQVMRDLGIPRGLYEHGSSLLGHHGRLVDETYRYDGPHLSEYDRTKWVAHYKVADPMIAQGLPLVIVQPGLIYGPGDTSTPARPSFILAAQAAVVPSGTAFCWAHVEDTARGHILAMDRGRPGEAYIIAGEATTSWRIATGRAYHRCVSAAPQARPGD